MRRLEHFVLGVEASLYMYTTSRPRLHPNVVQQHQHPIFRLSTHCQPHPPSRLSMSHFRRLNFVHRTLTAATRPASTLTMPQTPKINRVSPLSADEAKWTELRKIEVS